MPDLDTQLRQYFDATAPPQELNTLVTDQVWARPGEQARHRGRMVPAWAFGLGALVLVLLVALGVNLLLAGDQNEVVEPTPPSVPESPLVGPWVASEIDGSTHTATFTTSEEGVVELVATDDYASLCSGAPSTMIGTGRLEGNTMLVFPEPILTCDDGSQPEALNGVPLEELLRNLTFTYHPESDTLADSVGTVWTREGSEAPNPEPTVSGGMWPQSNLEEVAEAQERADAGDPDYTWQLGTQLTLDDPWAHISELQLVDRFLRGVLGWEAYLFNGMEGGDGDGWADGRLQDMRFLRCAPDRTNPLYPPDPDGAGEACAPTIDDLNYESVSLNLAQLDRQGPDGIWVVNNWRADRVARAGRPGGCRGTGHGTFGGVPGRTDRRSRCRGVRWRRLPGSPQVRRTSAPLRHHRWRPVRAIRDRAGGRAGMDRRQNDFHGPSVHRRRRNPGRAEDRMEEPQRRVDHGQLVPVPYYVFDGEIVASAPGEWWEDYWSDEQARFIDFTDPVAPDPYGSQGCEPGTAPGDAAAIAEAVIADPNFVTTAPVATRIGGFDALSMDVALAPGVGIEVSCWSQTVPIGVWIYSLAPELRQRLYLVDVPEGMSMRTLAITVTGHESRFEEIVEEAQPIIHSIEFHSD